MEFYNYLMDTYGKTNPFVIKEINYNEEPYDTIKKKIYKLEKENKIKKLYRGIFYIPEKGSLGDKVPSFSKVIERKYLKQQNNDIGFIAGLTLENIIGISTQVSNVYEIVSNNESAIVREILLGKHKIILRKPFVTITSKNVCYLQFLELLRTISEENFNKNKNKIWKYYKKKGVELKESFSYLKYYPNKVSKRFMEVIQFEIIRK